MLKIIINFCTQLFIVFLIFAIPAYSEDKTSDIKLLIEEKLKTIDSALQTIVNDSGIRKMNLEIGNIAFKRIIKRYPAILSIKRSSSKGLLVNDIFGESEAEKLYFNVSENDWFRIPLESLNSYYGPIIKMGRINTVIWSKPIKIEIKPDEYKFSGIIAFTIDIDRVLTDIIVNFNNPVKCLYNNGVFFTYNWDDSKSYEEYPIELNSIKLFHIQQINNHTSPAISSNRKPEKQSKKNDAKTKQNEHKSSQPLLSEMHENENSSYIISEINSSPSKKNRIFFLTILLISSIIGGLTFASVKFLFANGIGTIIGSSFESRENDKIIAGRMNRYQQKYDEVDFIRSKVLDEVREEIDDNITKSDILELLEEIRDNIYKRLYEKISRDEGNIIKDVVINDLKEIFKIELKNTVYQEVINEYADTYKEEFISKLRKEIQVNIKKSEMETGAIKQQCAQQFKEEVYAAVKSDYEKEFIEKAKRELETEINKTIKESEIQNITKDIREKMESDIYREISEKDIEQIRSKIQKKFIEEFSVDIWKNEQESLLEQAREMVYRELYNKVLDNESENIREKAKEKLTLEIADEINASQRDKITRRERENIRQDIIAILRNNEYTDIYNRERQILSDKVKQKLEKNEYTSIEEEQYAKISEEIRNQIRSNDLDKISSEIREEISQLIKKQIEYNEKDIIYASIKNDLIEQIKHTIKEEEINALKSQVFEEIVQMEKKRIYDRELPEIIYKEKKRLAEKEYEKIRLEVIQEIYKKEIPQIREDVKNEIYSETVDQIEEELTVKINKSMEKTLYKRARELEKTIKSEFRKNLQEEYHYLIGIVRNMKTSLKGIEPVDSLRHTVLRLTEEKNKNRYFNLNASHTESLLEYLQRLQGNFDTYFQSLENTVISINTKVNDILNELGDDKTLL